MINDLNSGSGDSNPESLTAVGNTLFFKAYDGSYGDELYTNRGLDTEVTYS